MLPFDPQAGELLEARDTSAWRDAPTHDEASLERTDAVGEAIEGERVEGEGGAEGEGQGRRRRRRRRRGRDGARDEAGVETRERSDDDSDRVADGETVGDDRDGAAIGTGEHDELGEGVAADGEPDDGLEAPAHAGDSSSADAGASTGGSRRRRRRRRRRGGGERGAEAAQGQTQGPAQARGPSSEPTAARDDQDGDEDDEDDEDGQAAGGDASESGEEGRGRRRRRRRRGRRRGGEPQQAPVVTAPLVVPVPKVGQDEIVVDIDESELQLVRDQFGEIDELDDFTLKARRRGVLDTLAEEVELEDLTLRDRETPASGDEATSVEHGEPAGDEAEGESDGDGEGETEGEAEGEGEGAATSDDDPNRRKRRRRRRKKKKAEPEPPQPSLMAPPHKDFWEVWASHFSYRDFEDAEAPEPEPEPEPPARGFDRSVPVPEGEWVTVRLSIGRAHARKAADVRDLLAERTGLSGKAVRNLTVREQDTELQITASAWPRLARAFTGAAIEGVAVSAELLVDDNADVEADDGDDGLPAVDEHAAAHDDVAAAAELEPAADEPDPGDAIEPAPAT